MLDRQRVRELYDAGARSYYLTTLLYRLLGLRMHAYRVRAVDALRLDPGGCVVELGCGTGMNFPLLLERLGPEGRLVGVDLSGGMLAVARRRVEKAGWRNVELVEQDVAVFNLPRGVNGILATGVFGYLAEYEAVIRRASEALAPRGRLVLLDGKQPENLPSWLFRIVLVLGRPFGYTQEYFDVRPWQTMERWLADVSIEQHYGGMIYIAAGTATKRVV
jgi:demethylmenaquinone methyltransferase/2-methoxy-6-polyprenyl-1,4-benzoquinol methylase